MIRLVALLYSVLMTLKQQELVPATNLVFHLSSYEEVGHGACGNIPEEISELLAVDMGCIRRFGSGILYFWIWCVHSVLKDSSGPYDYELTSRLINLAKDNQLGYAVDIYPMYGSDASAAFTVVGKLI